MASASSRAPPRSARPSSRPAASRPSWPNSMPTAASSGSPTMRLCRPCFGWIRRSTRSSGGGLSATFFVALYYLATANAPISPTSTASLAGAFVTYYVVRYVAFFSAFWEAVPMVDILRSQQCWFSFSFCHTMGVWDALFSGGSKFGWVANTGASSRRSWMEWFNILTVGALLGGIAFRLVAFIVLDDGCAPYENVGAVFFAGYVAWMMAPVARVSLAERLSSASEAEREGKALPIPVPLVAAALTILGVVFLSGWANTRCGLEAKA
eukprot:TRINITY_DN3852_c0_g1_i6.p1 TRINITY_DN3852_c0_g1~~TRINITY_DN3852_c0_g1_i6.p1  ORF type:complete len:267 (+),score=69.71 TRINITY_DN3852_c0_g1_i6:202-1002(+)